MPCLFYYYYLFIHSFIYLFYNLYRRCTLLQHVGGVSRGSLVLRHSTFHHPRGIACSVISPFWTFRLVFETLHIERRNWWKNENNSLPRIELKPTTVVFTFKHYAATQLIFLNKKKITPITWNMPYMWLSIINSFKFNRTVTTIQTKTLSCACV